MTYERFEDIPVWQAGIELAERVFKLTGDRAFGGQGDVANQLQRAALSVSNNVAEGFERGSTNELIAFLYYARGSAGETRSILCLLERMERFGHLKSQISDLKLKAESCSRQLRGWADHLQNTPIRGQRHLNEGTRSEFEQGRKAEAFRERLQRVREGSQNSDLKSEISDLKSQLSDSKSQIPEAE
ncbi:MAG: four helix bundle protein [Tepidisphaeraceae bacterium]|jgi:four helix bundle protein